MRAMLHLLLGRSRYSSKLFRLAPVPAVVLAVVGFAGLHWDAHSSSRGSSNPPVEGSATTNLYIGKEILHSGVLRFGINLSGQTFYDSGQMMKNLVFRNPGFEGETWQSFLHCKAADPGSCTDDNQYSAWPAGFLDGAHYEVISGKAAGQTGTVLESLAASNDHGIRVLMATPAEGLEAGDFLLVTMEKPGDAAAGWWTSTTAGAKIATEYHDLAPNSPGKQALRLEALQADQYASVSSYFDSTSDRSFLQLRGPFTLRFRAKWLAAGSTISVSVSRFDKLHTTGHSLMQESLQLAPEWRDYCLPFHADEDGSALGPVALTFATQQNAFLLDDVSLTPTATGNNPTAYRDEVVETLRALRPGIIRFMDNGTSFGSRLDDLLAPAFARRRGGWHLTNARAEDIPMGLDESLRLAQAIHADPWYSLPGTISPSEMSHLIEYLSGPASTPFGAKRASFGQVAPWTSVFRTIHLEFGNEMWNAGDFGGEALPSPTVYAARTAAVFTAARASPFFNAAQLDLIADGQAGNTWLTTHLLEQDLHANSVDFAPYLFSQLDDASSNEAVFGAMFSMPEQQDTPSNSGVEGIMAQQVRLARSARYALVPAVYEVNLSTNSSTNNRITQQQINTIVPSLGSAIALADHMLLMLRNLGITSQCVFSLPEYRNGFNEPDRAGKTTPLWGSVIDMGGPTDRRRPTYLALELMNRAILNDELGIHMTGSDPTWDQPATSNGPTPSTRARLLQAFAFMDGAKHSVILLNLSRTSALPVSFSGSNAPKGVITEARLTSEKITDTNEDERKVATVTRQLHGFQPGAPYQLPPFSMTVLSWEVAR